MTIIIQKPIVKPCLWCHREVDDPETLVMVSALRGTPDKDWLTMRVVALAGDHLDDEVSFGPGDGAMIRLCCACRDGLMNTLDPDCVLDYRDGYSFPKIVNRCDR